MYVDMSYEVVAISNGPSSSGSLFAVVIAKP
jgi:hypothetical protein